MILDLFRYFARFPKKEGVVSMFANGSSDFIQYAELLEYAKNLPEPIMPKLENLVFGQSYDYVKKRVDNITGNYLFVDFGEFTSSRDARNSIIDQQKLAVTIAMKVSDSADMVETAIVSEMTLSLLAELRKSSFSIPVLKICPGLTRYRRIMTSFPLSHLNSNLWAGHSCSAPWQQTCSEQKSLFKTIDK